MNLKIKALHPDFTPPRYATADSAAFDLVALEDGACLPGTVAKIDLGFACEIEPGHAMFITARSGHGLRHGAGVPHGYGLIDADYRGEISMILRTGTFSLRWKKGDRIGQAVVMPVARCRFAMVEELSATARGDGGFGSTGS